ncbi:MPN domain-containing protein [Meloidogyne graminicola]|uniref:MPN domain-containing protein n=1 Tax=Meloidogyne graminicola TaxID=189291 RepID=A0A8S9ZFR3_9BILA|nr:MPN domain-containing protein [Meloidogyne graminicola]
MVPLPGQGTDKDHEKPKVGHCLSSVQTNLPVNKVVVHPLVLLSVVDHFNRISKTQRVSRVVGILLGSMSSDKTIDTSNSFAVPYDEDSEDSCVFFLDADYLEDMFGMFYKVAAREKIVGWYHTGPKLCKNDILINEVIKRFVPNPVLVIIQASQDQMGLGLPTDAYVEVQEVHDVSIVLFIFSYIFQDGSPPIKTFEHVSCEIGAEEAEEVGVEHLLRDIKNTSAGTLSQRITNQLLGLRGFRHQLAEMALYARRVVNKELPEILNLLPDVLTPEFVDAHNSMSNDQAMRIYLGNLARTVIALDDLIDNKLMLQRDEEKTNEKKKADVEDKSKEKSKSDEGKQENV